MDLAELLGVLWRRKLVLVATVLLVMGAAAALLVLQPRIYRSTSTLALIPADQTDPRDAAYLIAQANVITPIYAEGVRSRTTKALAQQKLSDDFPDQVLAKISVRTIPDVPVLKVDASDTDAFVASNSAQAITDALLERATRNEVGYGIIRVIQVDRPVPGTTPVSPRERLTLAVATILGIGFGVGAALLRENLGRKIDTAEQLSQAAGVPCFGEIPADRVIGRLRSIDDLVSDARFRVLAEALRDVRTSLQFTEGGFHSVVLTSPEGRHGKTTVAFGLAVTLARSGARTLLIDGDVRRGRLAEVLAVPPVPGLMEVLKGTQPEQAVSRTSLDNLDAMPRGQLEEDPGELLEREFFSVLFRLERMYDAVVIDGTPLVPVNDARLIAKYASCTLVVASAGTVTRRQLRAAIDRLALIGEKPTAVVLNNSKTRRPSGYYAYLTPTDPERTSRR